MSNPVLENYGWTFINIVGDVDLDIATAYLANITSPGEVATLPISLNYTNGGILIQKVDNSGIPYTISARAGELINGQPSVTLTNQYDGYLLYSDGSTINWQAFPFSSGFVISVNGAKGNITINGTIHQITTSTIGNVITLSLPQNIDISASPTFTNVTANLTGTATGNQLFISSAVNGDIVTTNSVGQTQDSGKFFGNDGTNNAVPTSSQMQSYVLAQIINAPTLPSVNFTTTVNDTLVGYAARDGVVPTAGMFALIKNQTNNDNSVYQVGATSVTPWTRCYNNAGSWSPITTQTTYAQLNINGGKVLVLAGTKFSNSLFQISVPNPAATLGTGIVYVTSIPYILSSPTNVYVDATIGSNNNNGSQAYPYATLAQAYNVGVTTTPSVINLMSNSAFTDSITWTSGKNNITIQGNNLSNNGGQQSLSGQQIIGTGTSYIHFTNTYHTTGATAPFNFASGAACRNRFRNITINSTALDWLGLNAGVLNFIILSNISFVNTNVINLPAFTNPFTIFVEQQDLFNGALLFTGTGAVNTNVVIDSKVGDGQVRLPSTYLGNITWGTNAFGVILGSTAHPIGIITSQADLTAVLNWVTNTTYDGFYAITGFTPTTFTAGAIFGKQTLAGVATNVWWGRNVAYAPASVRDNTTTYQFNLSTLTWSPISSTVSSSVPIANTISRWDANKNFSADAFIAGYQSVVTFGAVLALNVNSNQIYTFTGTTTQTVVLPDATTLVNGMYYVMNNASTGVVTVQTFDTAVLVSILSNTTAVITLNDNSTTPGNWFVNTPGTITSSSVPTANTISRWDSDKNFSANNFLNASTVTVTSNGTTTLTVASTGQQVFTGTTTQTVVLPDATTLAVGTEINIVNTSSVAITIKNNGGQIIGIVNSNTNKIFNLTTNVSISGTWYANQNPIIKFTSKRAQGIRGFIFIYNNNLYRSGYTGTPFGTTTGYIYTPTIIPMQSATLINGWQEVVYTYDSAIALTTDGKVFEWGSTTGLSYGTQVIFPGGVVIAKIYGPSARGSTSVTSWFAITTTGAVYSWRNNSWGQLGIGNTVTQTSPQLITAFNGKIITKISVSGNNGMHIIALDSLGNIYTCGYGGSVGGANPLGTGVSNTSISTPYTVPIGIIGTVSDVIAVSQYDDANSRNFTRILTTAGTTWATGTNSQGQLATGNTSHSTVFVRESLNLTNIAAIYGGETASGGASVIVNTSGNLFFSGNNNDSCFGDGSANNSNHLTFTNTAQLNSAGFQGKMLPGPLGITPNVLFGGVIQGYNYCIILDNTGTVWTCGQNSWGQTGQGTASNPVTAWGNPIGNPDNTPAIAIAPLGYFNQGDIGIMIAYADGTLRCCGINNDGGAPYENYPQGVTNGFLQTVVGFSQLNK